MTCQATFVSKDLEAIATLQRVFFSVELLGFLLGLGIPLGHGVLGLRLAGLLGNNSRLRESGWNY